MATASSHFNSTRWSLVLESQNGSDTALNDLCALYWKPIFGFVRSRCSTHEEAEDLTQGYFSHFLARDYLSRANENRGRLRSFLITDLKFFLSNERTRRLAKKRQSDLPDLRIDFSDAPENLISGLVDFETPDEWFDRRWALEVFQIALKKVKSDYENRGRGELFDRIKFCLEGADSGEYEEIAVAIGKDTNFVKQQVFRLRQRFRIAFRSTIADTVASPEEVEEELKILTQSIRR